MCRAIRSWLPVVLLLSFPGTAVSEEQAEDPMTRAKVLYAEGKVHFEAGRYQEAMDAFTESYNLSNEQNLLYNLGSSAERLGDTMRAIAYFELYLEEVPDAPDREEVEQRLAKLKNPPPRTVPPTPSSAKPAVVATAPPVDESERPPTTDKDASPKPEVEPEEREVFWPGIPLAIGGLLLAGGTVTAISASQNYGKLESSCSPDCTEKEMSTSKNLALTTDVLYGAGAVAVVTGIIIWIVDSKRKEKARFRAISAAPTGMPGGGGLILEGRF